MNLKKILTALVPKDLQDNPYGKDMVDAAYNQTLELVEKKKKCKYKHHQEDFCDCLEFKGHNQAIELTLKKMKGE